MIFPASAWSRISRVEETLIASRKSATSSSSDGKTLKSSTSRVYMATIMMVMANAMFAAISRSRTAGGNGITIIRTIISTIAARAMSELRVSIEAAACMAEVCPPPRPCVSVAIVQRPLRHGSRLRVAQAVDEGQYRGDGLVEVRGDLVVDRDGAVDRACQRGVLDDRDAVLHRDLTDALRQ